LVDIPSTKTSFISISKTAGDVAQPISDEPIPFYEINIHCYTNDAYYGNGVIMSAILGAGQVASFRNGRLNDIFIQNKTAGSNAAIVITATVPTEYLKADLGFE